ncbi:MAG: FecCD family ABC transporter permease [Pseudonocardiaceae bacterium]
MSLPVHRRSVLVCGLVLATTAVVGGYALASGPVTVAPLDVVRTLLGHGSSLTNFAVLELRLPRLLTGILVGAALGISGAVFQSLSRNPLGSPDIIGFTYGSVTGGLLVITFFSGTSAAVSGGAVVGGLATALLVYLLAWQQGVRGYRLVLVGLGMSAILQSVNFYLLVSAQLADATRGMVWLTGSLSNRGWAPVGPLAIALLLILPSIMLVAGRLTMLEMGDDTAHALGVPVERTRLYLLVTGTAACAVATAAAGPIAFVALAAPQLARRLTRTPGPGLLPATCVGALIVTVADVAVGHVPGLTTLPVGVATATLGGAYLGWLLWRREN